MEAEAVVIEEDSKDFLDVLWDVFFVAGEVMGGSHSGEWVVSVEVFGEVVVIVEFGEVGLTDDGAR